MIFLSIHTESFFYSKLIFPPFVTENYIGISFLRSQIKKYHF